jgi:flagellar basal body-associated protein FliL
MPEEKPESRVPRRRRRSVIVLILPILIVAAIALWFWASRGSEAAQAGGDNPVRSTLHLESFVLNAADTEQRAYLRVGIDLGLNQDAKRAAEAAPVAQVRDTILGVLGEAKVDDLMTSAGKKKLKEDILRALRERVPQLGVEEVYFTEFLIQR